jgi:amino acid transporter
MVSAQRRLTLVDKVIRQEEASIESLRHGERESGADAATRFGEVLLGKPLRTDAQNAERVGPLSGVPLLGLDALASAAYGPEAALTVLMPLGLAAAGQLTAVMAGILVLLALVGWSYRQTIAAYPQGGGSYRVAKENLGRWPGLLAATALSIDYVLNVAVAISAGVGALISAVPRLQPYTLPLCLVLLAALTLINLRGVRSTGKLFMLPTYLFIACLAATIATGAVKVALAHGRAVPLARLPGPGPATSAASAWLLLRAFAAGCTALTGIEAVSNAVPIFREPSRVMARRTLLIIVAVLGLLLVGVAFLCRAYHLVATVPGAPGYESVLSQMTAAVAGRGAFYSVTIGAVVAVLVLSANTSFAGFPRVCSLLAFDEYLPAGFAHRGRRLVYSRGIIVLAILSGALLIAFGGVTDRLIPLFAVGAFAAFLLSQAGMVAHWRRQRRDPAAARSLFFNAAGTAATALALLIICASKFKDGAWLTIVVIPPLLYLLAYTQRRHAELAREVGDEGPVELDGLAPPLIVVPLRALTRVTRRALRLALSMSRDVQAIQVLADEIKTDNLASIWGEMVEAPARRAGLPAPELLVLRSPYREFFGPLLAHLHALAAQHPGRTIAVMVPELVERRWYQFFARHRATVLKGLLLMRGDRHVVIINSPWYLDD